MKYVKNGRILLCFKISISELTAIDFLLMCDFDKKNDQEDFMIPHLIKQPESIINLEIQENKINYLIFKSNSSQTKSSTSKLKCNNESTGLKKIGLSSSS